jgi:hypothetical protein
MKGKKILNNKHLCFINDYNMYYANKIKPGCYSNASLEGLFIAIFRRVTQSWVICSKFIYSKKLLESKISIADTCRADNKKS